MICPVCQARLIKDGKSYVCENRHNFDIAKEGYVNLLLSSQKKSKCPGDSNEMMLARSEFLNAGYYEKAADAICDMIASCAHDKILDAGCGEGYYTNLIANRFSNSEIYGIDISKDGVRRGKNKKVGYIVGSIFRLPFENEDIDVITNIFAPYCETEFYRVLKNGGSLIIACAGKEHLKELRQIIYENEKGHDEKEFLFKGFCEEERKEIKYKIDLDATGLKNLFKMTPYYFQAPLEQKNKIETLERLKLTVDFEIIKLTKEEKMFNIAIDGFGGCGKSTLSQGLAEKLGFKTLNTGSIYRALACRYLDEGLPEKPTEKIIDKFVEDIKIDVFFEGDLQHVKVKGVDYTPYLREEKISDFASIISPFPKLRNVTLRVQREFAKNNNCIIEGRGIGIDVLPNADLKLFLTARPEVRAMRRYQQIKNTPNAPTFDEILQDLNERDYRDVHREHGANVPASDAVILDTSDMTLEESIQKAVDIFNEMVEERN